MTNSFGLGTNAGWWPPDEDAARDYMAYATATGKEQSLRQFDQLVEQTRGFIPPDKSGGRIFELLSKKIENGEAASLIRLGDADGNVLFHARGGYDRLSEYCLKKISRIYFGSEKVMVDDADFFARSVLDSVRSADIVGAPERGTIERSFETPLAELDVRGMVGMRAVYDYFAAQPNPADWVGGTYWTSTWVSRSLLPYYPKLIRPQKFLGLVTCYDEMSVKLQAAHGVEQIDTYLIPMQASIAKKNGNIGHYPDKFHETMAALKVPFNGALFIVAAGILSKPYCSRIKELGGVAIDIGSAADVWMGVKSRPGMTTDLVERWQL